MMQNDNQEVVKFDENPALVDAWLAYYQSLEDDGSPIGHVNVTSPNYWAVEQLDEMAKVQPELCWKLILEISGRAKIDLQRAVLAAGPIEDLLSQHGSDFIERVEEEANRNERFRELLAGVWRNAMSAEVWDRVQHLCDSLEERNPK